MKCEKCNQEIVRKDILNLLTKVCLWLLLVATVIMALGLFLWGACRRKIKMNRLTFQFERELNRYNIFNPSEEFLGTIYFHSSWKCWVVNLEYNCIFDKFCLLEIFNHLDGLQQWNFYWKLLCILFFSFLYLQVFLLLVFGFMNIFIIFSMMGKLCRFPGVLFLIR